MSFNAFMRGVGVSEKEKWYREKVPCKSTFFCVWFGLKGTPSLRGVLKIRTLYVQNRPHETPTYRNRLFFSPVYERADAVQS